MKTQTAHAPTPYQWPTKEERNADRNQRRIIGSVKDFAEGRIIETAYLDTAWGMQKATGIRFWPHDPWIVTGDRSYMVFPETRLFSEGSSK